MFRAQFPQVQFRIEEAPSAELDHKLLEGEIDLAFYMSLARHPGLNYRVLRRDRMYAVFGKGHPLEQAAAREGSFAWEWLEGQTLLLQNQTQRQGQYILQELRSRRLHPAEILESSNIRAAAALAANGYGIGFLSGELLEHLNNAVPFNAFPLRDCTLPLESVAAWRAGNYLPGTRWRSSSGWNSWKTRNATIAQQKCTKTVIKLQQKCARSLFICRHIRYNRKDRNSAPRRRGVPSVGDNGCLKGTKNENDAGGSGADPEFAGDLYRRAPVGRSNGGTHTGGGNAPTPAEKISAMPAATRNTSPGTVRPSRPLRTRTEQCRLEFFDPDIAQVIARYYEVDGKPYVLEMIKRTHGTSVLDMEDSERFISSIPGYATKIYRDALTGVYNRRYYEETVSSLIGPAGVAVMDLDDFKIYNDTYGHHAGDLVLETVARVIRNCIRQTDTLIRFGGDEFLLLLPGIPAEKLSRKAGADPQQRPWGTGAGLYAPASFREHRRRAPDPCRPH